MWSRTARIGAEEEIIFQQVRVVHPARVSRFRGSPLLLVHNVLLLFISKDLAKDLHIDNSMDRACGLYLNATPTKQSPPRIQLSLYENNDARNRLHKIKHCRIH